MQIVVRQTSGLGNQLFQYAAGRYLAKKHAASLRVAHEIQKNLYKHGAHRPVMLQKFAIRAPIQAATAFDRFILSPRPRLDFFAKWVRTVAGIQVIREPADTLTVRHELAIDRGVRVAYLRGYWQAYWIVREVEKELRREFAPAAPLSNASHMMAQRILAAHSPVSLHLRRGDYVTVFGHSAVLSMGYYEKAIQQIKKDAPRSSFFVFSDDPAYAKQRFGSEPDFVVVDINNSDTAHEDLVLMSMCHHHIIANSTFSWWGAWLNPRGDKQVLAPSRWLGVDTAQTSLIQPGWTLIESGESGAETGS
jgi:hypothetical protein